jgi:hypothetical protein
MPDHVHMLLLIPPIFVGTNHRIHERQELDLNRAERRTQDAEFSRPQIQGAPICYHDRRAGPHPFCSKYPSVGSRCTCTGRNGSLAVVNSGYLV